jgi:adenylate cyclase class 2
MREIEIKFPIVDRTTLREKLETIGRLKKARLFEDNIVFDDERGTLFKKRQLLRLRSSGAVLLTFKNPVEQGRYKIMEEHEVVVSDFNSALSLLTGLGYRQVFRYQKYRTEYRVNKATVLLDETPIGDYVEIEGETQMIDRIAHQLGFDINEGISKNYLQLFREYARRHEDGTDMVFRSEGTS